MDGGLVSEPLVDLCALMASLHDVDGRVRVPTFADNVAILSDVERGLYNDLEFNAESCRGLKHVCAF
jgi:hypothetical protein